MSNDTVSTMLREELEAYARALRADVERLNAELKTLKSETETPN